MWVFRATGIRVSVTLLSEAIVAPKHPCYLHASEGTPNPKPREHQRF